MKPSGSEILFVVDAPNWAHDYKTRHLQKVLGNQFQLTKRFQEELTETDLDRADLIVVYYWLQVSRLNPLKEAFVRNRRKLLIGVCSHVELEGHWREPGLAMLRELPRGIFVVNRSLYRELRTLLTIPVFYTPNGVDTSFFRPPIKPLSRGLVNGIESEPVQASGHPGKWKSVWRRIGGDHSTGRVHSPNLASTKTPLRVGWAGSLSNQGPELRGFHDLIVPAVAEVDGAELVAAIREEKWRDPEQMLEFYHSLDVYLCASRSEGTPNPCLEAAACGVPVLTTRVGCMNEFIQEGLNGFFIERRVSDISAKMSQLRDDPGLRVRMGKHAVSSARAWDWKLMAQNYRSMLEECLRGEGTTKVITTLS